jgi:hypothetical protein
MGDLSLMVIGVRSPDHDANLRYADELTRRLRAMPASVVQLATYNVRDLKGFFEKNKWLYASRRTSRRSATACAARSAAKNPLVRFARRGGIPRRHAEGTQHKDAWTSALPGRRAHEQRRRVRLDRRRRAALRRERGEVVQGGARADRRAAARDVPPQMRAEVTGPIATATPAATPSSATSCGSR